MEDLIVIGRIQYQHVADLTTRLAGYAKSCSIVWLRGLGLPVLDGLILDGWDSGTKSSIDALAESFRSTSLLLRIDRRGQRWTERRGGFLVDLNTISQLWLDLAQEQFLPILLEPASPYTNRCAFTAVLLEPEAKLIVEIVGAGFDASDVLRGDLTPHERWDLPIVRGDNMDFAVGLPQRTFLISQEAYSHSREVRLLKVGAKLRDPSFPRKVEARVPREQLLKEAESSLNSMGETVILEAASYHPVRESLVLRFAEDAVMLKGALNKHRPGIGSISLAASVIADGRMVYWDFFPQSKQEIPLLWG